MYCPKCGKELKEGAKFCSGCGASMNVEKTASELEKAPKEIEGYEEAEKNTGNPENSGLGPTEESIKQAGTEGLKEERQEEKNVPEKQKKRGIGNQICGVLAAAFFLLSAMVLAGSWLYTSWIKGPIGTFQLEEPVTPSGEETETETLPAETAPSADGGQTVSA